MRNVIAILAACLSSGCGDDSGAPAADATVPDVGVDRPLPDAPPPPGCPDAAGAGGTEATTPGEATLPYPTLRHISVEWMIEGDSDLDGVVSVRYRAAGAAWHGGFPLRRVPAGSAEGFSWANKHSGSLFDLEPATTYEVELALSDPDGGCEIRTLAATTRAVPAAAAGARVVPVTSVTFATAASSAAPGDILELASGRYAGFTFTNDGTATMPTVIRAAVRGGAVIDGDVRLDGRSHVYVDGLTVNGKIKFNGGNSLAITHCNVTTTEDGILTYTRSENLYIADNIVTGATVWAEGSLGVDGNNIGEGILVTGPGHVIEHNRVSGFRDGISFLEDGEAVDQFSIDVIDNDISEAADDGIEADFCFHNCRIVRNRLTNIFIALSSQPGLGGPTWFIRNTMYNVILSAFKLQRGSVGDVCLHNTAVKNGDALGIYTNDVFSRQLFRNNVFIGGPGGEFGGWSSGSGRVAELRAADPSCDFDYDAYGSTLGTFAGNIGGTAFNSLAEMRSMTSEVHAIEVDLSAFQAGVTFPASPFPALSVPDLRPASNGALIDQGTPLTGINESFAGSAPDIGAYETGQDLPAYGPRD